MRNHGVDHMIDRVAGLDHEHDVARRLQQFYELRDRMCALDGGSLGFVIQEVIDLGSGAVKDGDLIPVVVHIQDQILAHYGETDEADITGLFCHHCIIVVHATEKM